ncbi:MAG: aminopeptidase, partial [Proteobacteria bacterium]|nr:aminopeptidase [Pseudomonadota bacterium]
RFDYRIFTFDQPLAPGARSTVRFESVLAQRGFRARGNLREVADNGTFINNFSFAPMIGMDRSDLLQDRAKRRKYGLPSELRMARLEDQGARASNYFPGNADWVKADITVSTVADQTPLAPGYKLSDAVANGRRTARFVTEAPILHFFSVQSARYAIERRNHGGVDLAIYHHPGHEYNIERMLTALRTGLDYYQSAFGPYQFRQARIVEFPYGNFAQAFANTMPYSENVGFIADLRDPEKIDYVTYITAHELGHQWWAHQIIGADMQGATTLSETLAAYSALMVMERLYGPDQMRRYLKYELDQYLAARGREVVEELPLIRVENQGYIHYEKGSLVMYLLKDRMGEARVNRALRRVLEAYKFQAAPYPSSVDLVRALRQEAGPEHQALITDLFERITLYDLKTTEVTSRRRDDGRYDVALTVEARKLYADGQGEETEAPLNESLDVGLFAAEVGNKAFNREDVILFERRPIRSGRQTLTFIADRAPGWAGVDPYNKLVDRNSGDNSRKAG